MEGSDLQVGFDQRTFSLHPLLRLLESIACECMHITYSVRSDVNALKRERAVSLDAASKSKVLI